MEVRHGLTSMPGLPIYMAQATMGQQSLQQGWFWQPAWCQGDSLDCRLEKLDEGGLWLAGLVTHAGTCTVMFITYPHASTPSLTPSL
jgi:hypothetical protein